MATDRYVLLGLARPRAEWFRRVAQWSNTAAIPAEFVKCVSAEELRARLTGGRPHSAVLVDGTLPAVDRDLLDVAREAGCVVLVVDDRSGGRDWRALGAAAVLGADIDRVELLDALATHARLVTRPSVRAVEGDDPDQLDAGRVVAVCGPGGTGTSTVAAALAQGLGDRYGAEDVVLADLARHAEQAMLHDVRDVAPGLQELVDAHRAGRPTDDEVRSLTFHVVERRYHLLLGLRRASQWSTLRPRAFEAAFATLRRCFGTVVCDVTADLEGEADSGSADVEERNIAARTAVAAADAVLVVGRPGAKGVHALVRVLTDVAAAGVTPARVVPVVNLAPRHPRSRAELAAAISELARPAMGGEPAPTVFLPTRDVEDAMRDVVPLPAPLPTVLAGAYDAVALRLGPQQAVQPEPVLVSPGSLGA